MENKNFEKQGFIIFCMSIMASGINYLFQIASGRILSTIEYGEFNSLFSVINILSVLGSAMGLSVAKYVAESGSNIGPNIKRIFKDCLLVSIPFILIATFVMSFVFNYNNLSSLLAVIAVFTTSIAFLFYGVLQGKKRFFDVGIYNLIQPAFKITVGVILLLLGVHYNCIFFTITLAAFVAITFAYNRLKNNVEFCGAHNKDEVNSIYHYFIFALLSTVALTIFNNIDILLVRAFFTETEVGIYSCAALFGKIILYIPTAFTIIMVPIVAENKAGSGKILRKTLLYSISLMLFASVGLYVFRKLIITLLMGQKYIEAINYVIPVCGMMLCLAIVTIFVNYLIAKGDKWFVSITSLIAIATVAVIFTLVNPSSIVGVLEILSLVYLVLSLIFVTKGVLLKK